MKEKTKITLILSPKSSGVILTNLGRKARPLLVLLCFCFLGGVGCQRQPGVTTAQQAEQIPGAETPVATAPETKPVPVAPSDTQVVDGIHRPTGLIADEGYLLVRNNCASCHSLDLVKSKRATREGWLSTIRWMQQTQGLWDLGENEKPILDYLAKNYAPEDTGRRKQLTEVEWYILEQ